MRASIAILALVLLAVPLAHAQRRPVAPIASTLTLDVIGPRRTASVRSWLRGNVRSLAACRGESDALAVVALAIGPDGTLVSVEPREDPTADAAATACVVAAMRGWRMPGRAGSVTTVSWSLRLAPAPTVECHCFGWVHGPDHGTSCSTTRARCEAEARESTRDHTECRQARLPRCSDHAVIDGVRMERP
jgi:hypothetical protein